jgi:quinol monooxygenase YgiN
MIPFIAKLHARPGKEAEAQAALHEAQQGTHQEPGCHLYALHVADADPGAFVMIEIWDSEESLDSHVASAHIQALIAKSKDLFEGDGPDILRLRALPYGDTGKGELRP